MAPLVTGNPDSVSETQSGMGSILFEVSDIYNGTIDENSAIVQGLSGSKIGVQNEEVLTVEAVGTSDALGEVLFTDLQAGRYKFRITAQNYHEKTGRFRIKPGITLSR